MFSQVIVFQLKANLGLGTISYSAGFAIWGCYLVGKKIWITSILLQMDKSWMLEDRRSRAYELGVEAFLKFAVENARNENRIPCPCWECGNTKDFGIGIIKGHLFSYGITPNYQNWIWHG
ncbi:uncharacterized protein LOC112194819 isoform X2 [Rosa chinensis]|uniref:uncharacterized protein LOC112194819 isoform X2 n=1 Tax=Rosa chinensis TaxID=74649 RepID=UPI001AD8FA70|nr:uncharacterized protein LOC112194819 isoform X2 [Rosa chinensis]